MPEIYAAKALFENETHFGVREKIRFNLAIDSFKASQEVGFFWNGKPPQNIVYSHIDANDRFTEARDDQMAKNFLALRTLAEGSKKSIIWAHNDHIKIKTGSAKSLGYYLSMGTFSPQSGVKYFALGLLARSITSYGVASKVPAGDYLENKLSALDLPKCLIDLSEASLFEANRPYSYGYFNGISVTGVPADEFSGFLFLEEAP